MIGDSRAVITRSKSKSRTNTFTSISADGCCITDDVLVPRALVSLLNIIPPGSKPGIEFKTLESCMIHTVARLSRYAHIMMLRVLAGFNDETARMINSCKMMNMSIGLIGDALYYTMIKYESPAELTKTATNSTFKLVNALMIRHSAISGDIAAACPIAHKSKNKITRTIGYGASSTSAMIYNFDSLVPCIPAVRWFLKSDKIVPLAVMAKFAQERKNEINITQYGISLSHGVKCIDDIGSNVMKLAINYDELSDKDHQRFLSVARMYYNQSFPVMMRKKDELNLARTIIANSQHNEAPCIVMIDNVDYAKINKYIIPELIR